MCDEPSDMMTWLLVVDSSNKYVIESTFESLLKRRTLVLP